MKSIAVEKPPALADLPERYELVRLLGEGSQKSVYLGVDQLLDRRVAIARLHPPLSESAFARLSEARAMARLGDHGNVVSIYDVIQTDDTVYIVSQYLEGGDLATHLREHRGPMDVHSAGRLASQISRAVEHAHSHGIAHCDIKPGNIFLDAQGNAFLGDFGLAQLNQPDQPSSSGCLGTLAYMAPERIAEGRLDFSSDLYSLGCLLFELVAGRTPFVSENPLLLANEILSKPPPSLRSFNPSAPTALDALVDNLLEKDPRARPASIQAVRAALEGVSRLGPAPRRVLQPSGRIDFTSTDIRSVPLRCRDGELDAIDRTLATAASGTPSTIVFEGDAGIGKTRLLDELRARAEEAGAITLFGAGLEDLSIPYGCFVEALLPIATHLESLDPADAAVIEELLYLGGDSPQSPSPAHRNPHRLLIALTRTLGRLSAKRPLVLAIDDLQWADSASIDLFLQLARGAARRLGGPSRLTIAATIRPTSADQPFIEAFSRLGRSAAFRHLRLGGLDEAGIYDTLLACEVRRPANQLVWQIQRATNGTPLFVLEVIDHLKSNHLLERQHGYTVAVGKWDEIQVPVDITSGLRGRFDRLDDACREGLAVGALLGPRFDSRRLGLVLGESTSQVASRLARAVETGLLARDGERFSFQHPLIRQLAQSDAGVEQRHRFHLQIAQSLIDEEGESRTDRSAEIAHHLIEARSLADEATLLRYARTAAERALERFAWREAAELLEAAIEIAGKAGSPLSDLADCHHKAGFAYFNLYDTGPCIHHLDHAVRLFTEAGDLRGTALALRDRARAAVQSGMVAYGTLQGLDPLEDILAKIDPRDHTLRATILGTLAESYFVACQPERAAALATEAAALAREIGDDALAAEICIHQALSQLQTLQLDAARSTYEYGIACARRANNLVALEQCLQRSALASYLLGDLESAAREASEAQRVNAIVQSGDDSWTFSTLTALAAIRGEHEDAERNAEEAVQRMRRAKHPWSGMTTLPALAYSRALNGDAEGAMAAIDKLVEPGFILDDPSPLEHFIFHYKVLIDAFRGEVKCPPESLHDCATIPDRWEEGFDFAVLPGLCAEVDLASLFPDYRISPQIHDALALAGERGVVFAVGWPFYLPRLLGASCALRGDWRTAETYFSVALSTARRIGANPEVARTALDQASLLIDLGGDGDRGAALRTLSAVRPLIEKHCPPLLRERAERLYQRAESA